MAAKRFQLGWSGVVLALVSAVLFRAQPIAALQPSFTGLGDLAGGNFQSVANAISGDGTTVVGWSSSTSGGQAFRWTRTGGIVGLGDLPGGRFSSNALGVSGDGSVIAGFGDTAVNNQAFRWTAATGMTSIAQPNSTVSRAWGVSQNGQVIVGEGSSPQGCDGFRWTAASGMVGLGNIAGANFCSTATATNPDGSVIVGIGDGPFAFRWTEATGMMALGDLPGGTTGTSAYAVSADGSVVVGEGHSSNGGEAFLWRASTGSMVGLGDLPGGVFSGAAFGITADGSIVVGRGVTATAEEAFIWDADHGMRNLKSVLQNDYGLNLSGWLLQSVFVSADGMAFAGTGQDPSGRQQAWYATIPEPSSAILAIATMTLLSLRHRNRLI